MTVHEFGEKGNPIIMLFPGTMCYWKGNFGTVIEKTEREIFRCGGRIYGLRRERYRKLCQR